MVDALERLIALEDIRAVKARYFRFVDSQDWDGFAAQFAADAVFDISDDLPDTVVHGAANIADKARTSLVGCQSVHHGHCPEIELLSPTTARAIWAMEDMLRWGDPSAPIRELHGYGHYHETYEKIAGRWVIKTLKLTRMRVDTVPR